MRRALTILATCLLLAVPAAAHETGREHTHLDLNADDGFRDNEGTGWSCTLWHELWPNYCGISHLEKIEGDGKLKACNFARFSDGRYHIDWVGPTYFWDCGFVTETGIGDISSDETNKPGDVHHEAWPDHGETHILEGWEDSDGDGVLGPCDVGFFRDGSVCHLQRVGLNIIISPAPAISRPNGLQDK